MMEHKIEHAPSGRATCRSCGKKIDKGDLRFGEAVKSQFGSSGFAYEWHHLRCAAEHRPTQLKPTLEAYEGDVPSRDELLKLADGGGKPASKGKGAPDTLPTADLAPTGRARCIACEQPIEAKSVRIAVERQIDTGSFVTKGAGYLHPGCAEDWAANEGVDLAELVDQVRAHTALTDLPAPFDDASVAAGG
jgi:hypothetical protein